MFQRNEEPLTGQSGPMNLAGKMPRKEKKTQETEERKTKKKSPTGQNIRTTKNQGAPRHQDQDQDQDQKTKNKQDQNQKREIKLRS